MPPCIFHNRQPTCLTLTHTTICHPSLHIYDLMRNTLTPGDRGRKVSSLVYSAIQQSWSETDHGCTVPFKGGREKQEKRNFSSGQNVKQYILWLSLSVDRSWPEVRICSEYMGGSWWFRQMVKDLKWMRLKTWGKEVERKSIKKNLWRWIQSVKIFMFYEIEHQKPPTIERVLNNQADKITHSGSIICCEHYYPLNNDNEPTGVPSLDLYPHSHFPFGHFINITIKRWAKTLNSTTLVCSILCCIIKRIAWCQG